MPTCDEIGDEIGQGAQRLIRALAKARVDEWEYAEDEEGRKAGEHSAAFVVLSQPNTVVSHQPLFVARRSPL